MRRRNANVPVDQRSRKSNQRGFFDAGLGLALVALFSLATSAIVSSEANKAEQQVASCATAAVSGDRPAVGCDNV